MKTPAILCPHCHMPIPAQLVGQWHSQIVGQLGGRPQKISTCERCGLELTGRERFRHPKNCLRPFGQRKSASARGRPRKIAP